jgi:hypothetical protein
VFGADILRALRRPAREAGLQRVDPCQQRVRVKARGIAPQRADQDQRGVEAGLGHLGLAAHDLGDDVELTGQRLGVSAVEQVGVADLPLQVVGAVQARVAVAARGKRASLKLASS